MVFASQKAQEDASKKDLGLQTVIGTIEPCSQDAQKVALKVEESGIEYSILSKGAGADLIDHVSEHMELSGFITEICDEDGDKIYTIQVRSYTHKD